MSGTSNLSGGQAEGDILHAVAADAVGRGGGSDGLELSGPAHSQRRTLRLGDGDGALVEHDRLVLRGVVADDTGVVAVQRVCRKVATRQPSRSRDSIEEGVGLE